MESSEASHAPQQQRSRQTLERLLLATVKVLDEHGLDGAVIPRIAATAEVAPASVYRRFVDKDALLRAALLHVLRTSNASNREHLPAAILRDTLSETAKRLVTVLFAQYQRHPRLLRALVRFMESDPDPAFRREAHTLIATSVHTIAEIVLMHRNRIRHPQPEQAVKIAILSMVSSIEAIALEPESVWHAVLPLTDEALGEQIAQAFVAYLSNRPVRSAIPSAKR